MYVVEGGGGVFVMFRICNKVPSLEFARTFYFDISLELLSLEHINPSVAIHYFECYRAYGCRIRLCGAYHVFNSASKGAVGFKVAYYYTRVKVLLLSLTFVYDDYEINTLMVQAHGEE